MDHASFNMADIRRKRSTSRRAVASAAIVIVLIASAAAVGSLLSAGGTTNLQAFDFFSLPFQFVYTIYGKRWPTTDYEPLASWLVIVANSASTISNRT